MVAVWYLFHSFVEFFKVNFYLSRLSFGFQLEMINQTSNYYSMQAEKKYTCNKHLKIYNFIKFIVKMLY